MAWARVKFHKFTCQKCQGQFSWAWGVDEEFSPYIVCPYCGKENFVNFREYSLEKNINGVQE